MKNKFNRYKMVFAAVLVMVATVPLGVVRNASAASQQIINPTEATVAPGDVRLYKTAEVVAGMINQWRIKLRVEAPKALLSSDTVIVLDRSGSMATGSRMTNAKNAASQLARQLLDANDSANPTNRVAIVSFSDYADNNVTWETEYGKIQTKINGIRANGGTFTQDAMHVAANLLIASDANIKNIVILSDGEPSYSFKINNPDNYLVNGGPETFLSGLFSGNERETSTNVPQSAYIYSGSNRRVGDGGEQGIGFWNPAEIMWWRYGGTINPKYYNHGNSAIAEAGFCKKNSACGNIYTIALDMDSDSVGNKVLNQMASPGKNYTATSVNLTTIFNDIAGEIKNAINSASIKDIMGDAIVVSGTNATEININNLTFTEDETLYGGRGGYYWEETYIVEASSDVSNTLDSYGNFLLNKEATLTYIYDGKTETETFPTPAVSKPIAIKVGKKLVGVINADAKFNMVLTGPDDFRETIAVKDGETKNIVKAFPAGNYAISEVGTTSNDVAIANYLKEYEINGADSAGRFSIAQGQTSDINIVVTNTYDVVNLDVVKVWDDAGDQDGVREDFYFAVKNDDGTIVGFQLIDKEVDRKEYHFSFPRWFNNAEIQYTVEEMINCQTVGGVNTCEALASNEASKYTMNREGNVFTNTHTPETINIAINKTWNDDNNRDGLRNVNTTVRFCVKGSVNGDTILERCNDEFGIGLGTLIGLRDSALIEFNDLPKYANKGVEIQYEVREDMSLFYNKYTSIIPEGYLTITNNSSNLDVENTHTPDVRDIEVRIVWDDDDNSDGYRPADIEVELTENGAKSGKKLVVDENGDGACGAWCVMFEDLFVNQSGSEIIYGVTQDVVPAEYSRTISGNMENGFVITYRHTSDTPEEPEGPEEPEEPEDPETAAADDDPIASITDDEGGKGGLDNNQILSPNTGVKIAKSGEAAVENNIVMLVAVAFIAVIVSFSAIVKSKETAIKKA